MSGGQEELNVAFWLPSRWLASVGMVSALVKPQCGQVRTDSKAMVSELRRPKDIYEGTLVTRAVSFPLIRLNSLPSATRLGRG